MKPTSFLCLPLVAALAACGGGDDEPTPRLASMDLQTSAHAGETLNFQPEVLDYTVRVQSDIYGVLLKAAPATPGAQVTVSAAVTAGAYSTTNPNTDLNQPETVPLSTVYGQSGYLVKMSQSYAAFDVEHVQTATVSVADPASGRKTDYRVRIVRDNDSAIRAKFGAEKVFTSAAGTSIKYRVYYPPNYQSSTKTYPVVLAMHGVGQRAAGGQPSDMVLKRTKQATIWAQDSERDAAKEAIVIAPQANTCWASADDGGALCPDGQAAYELLQEVLAKEKVNRGRVYLTGLSMGGNGALVMAETYPATFAALWIHAAWAGSPNSDTATGAGFDWAGMKAQLNGRIRVDQAADDPQVTVKSYNNLVARLNANGISYQAKLYPSGTFFYPDAHFSWIASYADKSARDWMFSLSR